MILVRGRTGQVLRGAKGAPPARGAGCLRGPFWAPATGLLLLFGRSFVALSVILSVKCIEMVGGRSECTGQGTVGELFFELLFFFFLESLSFLR